MNELSKKRVLNAGAGGGAPGSRLPGVFQSDRWEETRLDINPATAPDLIGSIVDMRDCAGDGEFDALYSAHTIEHLYAHQVESAFREFRRVIKSDGFALLTCPDLVAVCKLVLEQGAESISYVSPAGPIQPIDMLFGHGASIARGYSAMAHHTGFTPQRIGRVALEAGFREVRLIKGASYDLWALLLAPDAAIEAIRPLFEGTGLSSICVDPPASAAATEAQAARASE